MILAANPTVVSSIEDDQQWMIIADSEITIGTSDTEE